MQKPAHSSYQYVVFQDTSTGATFRVRSTCTSNETIQWRDGKTYPLVALDVSGTVPARPAYRTTKKPA